MSKKDDRSNSKISRGIVTKNRFIKEIELIGKRFKQKIDRLGKARVGRIRHKNLITKRKDSELIIPTIKLTEAPKLEEENQSKHNLIISYSK